VFSTPGADDDEKVTKDVQGDDTIPRSYRRQPVRSDQQSSTETLQSRLLYDLIRSECRRLFRCSELMKTHQIGPAFGLVSTYMIYQVQQIAFLAVGVSLSLGGGGGGG